jgi:hypothetical protein
MLIPAAHWGSVIPFQIPNSAKIYDNPLMWQLWPNVAAGDATPYYTCALAGGTVQDWEGVLRKCKANEARFPGARRVENLILGNSQNLTVSPWTAYNVGLNSAAPVLTWNYGGSQATRCQLNRGNDLAVGVCSMYQVLVVPYTTAAFRLTVDLWTLGNPITLVVALSNQINNLTITNTGPVRYSFLVTANFASAPSFAIGLYGTNSGGVNNSQSADLMVGRVQFELISGQSNTNPGEYVSVGMSAQVFSNVDGVRCFGTKLGNTMTGNVVNEIAGSISLTTTNGASAAVCDTLGPTGLLVDNQQTVAYGIEWDFTVAGAANMSYINKAVAGPTGDYYGCAVVENTVNGAHYINPYGTLPFATTNTFFGFFVKPYQRTNIQMNSSIGNDTGVVRWDLTGNGAVTYAAMGGTGGGTLRGSGIIPYKNGWYVCWVLQSATAAQTAMNIGIFGEYGGSYAGSGSTAWYLYGLTVMDTGSDPYTYCQYATATRGTDQLTPAGSGQNVIAANGTVYAEIKTKWQTAGGNHHVYFSGDNNYHSPLMAYNGWPSTSVFMYDGTYLPYQTGLPDASIASRKVASSWNNAIQRLTCTGSGIAAGTGTSATLFNGSMASTGPYMSIGYSAWPALAMGGQIRNVRVWNVAASPGELAALTA